MFLDSNVPLCVTMERRYLHPNSAREHVDPIAPQQECPFCGSVSFTGRLAHVNEANVDLYNRQNELSQFLLETAFVWDNLKEHLKLIAQKAFSIAQVRDDQYISHIATNFSNRGRLLTAHAYHHLAGGCTQLAEYVQEEPSTEYLYCNNAVIVDLVAFIGDIFQPSVLKLHNPAQRWRENVELWIARDQWKPYIQTLHFLTVSNQTGALKPNEPARSPHQTVPVVNTSSITKPNQS